MSQKSCHSDFLGHFVVMWYPSQMSKVEMVNVLLMTSKHHNEKFMAPIQKKIYCE